MIQKLSESTGNVLGFRITGEITKKRREQVSSTLAEAIAEHGAIRLLLIIEPYRDITIGADGLYENLKFVMPHTQGIEKLAVVGHKVSEGTYMAIFGLFSGMVVEYFDRARLEAAWKWVRR